MTAGYSGTPLPRKLGITATSRVLIVGAPAGLDLAGLSGAATAHTRPGREPYDVVVLFCRDIAGLVNHFDAAAGRHTTSGSIWVCWPKKSSGLLTDLTENAVRGHGLAHGRVDVKIAAVDPTWSALKFVIRLADR